MRREYSNETSSTARRKTDYWKLLLPGSTHLSTALGLCNKSTDESGFLCDDQMSSTVMCIPRNDEKRETPIRQSSF